jgi:hypothetical protein
MKVWNASHLTFRPFTPFRGNHTNEPFDTRKVPNFSPSRFTTNSISDLPSARTGTENVTSYATNHTSLLGEIVGICRAFLGRGRGVSVSRPHRSIRQVHRISLHNLILPADARRVQPESRARRSVSSGSLGGLPGASGSGSALSFSGPATWKHRAFGR